MAYTSIAEFSGCIKNTDIQPGLTGRHVTGPALSRVAVQPWPVGT
jgi:hypothetical protein